VIASFSLHETIPPLPSTFPLHLNCGDCDTLSCFPFLFVALFHFFPFFDLCLRHIDTLYTGWMDWISLIYDRLVGGRVTLVRELRSFIMYAVFLLSFWCLVNVAAGVYLDLTSTWFASHTLKPYRVYSY